ncbi:hypothetical protein [Legionella yabuuchiae]|uniref:hypothetical protein n=1 Tax=Legionella yabuuchiae TaxID=376727 RepID=UPI001055A3C9|nr:hypothetical protein [Legionella yabuuchiae]
MSQKISTKDNHNHPLTLKWLGIDTYRETVIYVRVLSKCVIYSFSFSSCRLLNHSQGNESLLDGYT